MTWHVSPEEWLLDFTSVPHGRVGLSARVKAALTASASAMSVTNMRTRTTSPMWPPSSSM